MIEEDKLNALELFGENEYLHKEIKRLKEDIRVFKFTIKTQQEQIKELIAREDKAIEYINKHTNNGMFELRSDTNEIEELLNILQGSGDNDKNN